MYRKYVHYVRVFHADICMVAVTFSLSYPIALFHLRTKYATGPSFIPRRREDLLLVSYVISGHHKLCTNEMSADKC